MRHVFGDSHRGSAFDVSTPLPQRLPLGAAPEPHGTGWRIRIPVYVERVQLGRDVLVAEEVEISLRTVQEVVNVDGAVRRDALNVEEPGGLDVTRPIHTNPAPRSELRRAPRSRVLRRLRNR